MTSEAVNEALLIYPFLYAALIVGAGFVGDKLGRKTIVSVCGALAVGGFIGFNISAWQGASPYLVGYFLRPVSGLLVDYPGLCWHDGCRICSPPITVAPYWVP